LGSKVKVIRDKKKKVLQFFGGGLPGRGYATGKINTQGHFWEGEGAVHYKVWALSTDLCKTGCTN